MTATQIYEQKTGNKCPSNQVAFCEWYIGYVAWLEKIVEAGWHMSVHKQN